VHSAREGGGGIAGKSRRDGEKEGEEREKRDLLVVRGILRRRIARETNDVKRVLDKARRTEIEVISRIQGQLLGS